MKTTVYNERLIKFAEHLQTFEHHPEEGLIDTLNIVNLIGENNLISEMIVPYWIFDELVRIFPEWDFDEFAGTPVLKDPELSWDMYNDICEFFDLTIEELSIFDLEGYQMVDKFGGKILNFESTTQDIAFNIMELANSRMQRKEADE